MEAGEPMLPVTLTFSENFFVITGASAAIRSEATKSAMSISTSEKAVIVCAFMAECQNLRHFEAFGCFNKHNKFSFIFVTFFTIKQFQNFR